MITATSVKDLREATGAGMMDCKKALEETQGDFEKAIDLLRKKGAKISANRADRSAPEGAVIAIASDNKKVGVIIRLSCETDFVAKNEEFVEFANTIANKALNENPSDLESLKSLDFDGRSLNDRLLDYIAKIGEKIDVTSYERVEGEQVVPYIHAGNKIGVLVALNKTGNAVETAGKDVAMQIAAMSPVALNKEEVSQEIINREIEIGKAQAAAEGKPEAMLEKIAMGKLNKFFKDSTLLNQDFVKDGSKTVSQMLNDVEAGLTVTQFKRIQLGA
ncbi:MAG: elongation factor Ts [Flavobacteriales bacterium]|nr:elongation factor Ts [Flavobacteriales bacterium]